MQECVFHNNTSKWMWLVPWLIVGMKRRSIFNVNACPRWDTGVLFSKVNEGIFGVVCYVSFSLVVMIRYRPSLSSSAECDNNSWSILRVPMQLASCYLCVHCGYLRFSSLLGLCAMAVRNWDHWITIRIVCLAVHFDWYEGCLYPGSALQFGWARLFTASIHWME